MTAASTLALLTGAMLVVASVLKLGFIAQFISEPVLTGFKAGLGLVIVADQIPKLLGLHFDKAGFVRNLVSKRLRPKRVEEGRTTQQFKEGPNNGEERFKLAMCDGRFLPSPRIVVGNK